MKCICPYKGRVHIFFVLQSYIRFEASFKEKFIVLIAALSEGCDEAVSSAEKPKYFDSLVESYFTDIRQAESLTDDETGSLFSRARSGDRAAYKKIIEANLKLVVSIAKRYAHNKLMFLDLVQEGNIGLIRSIKKFKPELGYKFSTFSSFWIKQEIIRSIENKGRMIRVPVNIAKTINKLKKLVDLKADATGRIDTKNIAEIIKVKEDKVEDLMQYFDDSCSIEKLIDKNCFNIFITDQENLEPEDIAIYSVVSDQIQRYLTDKLTSRERETVTLRFGLLDNVYKTHQEVADILQVSRERVRQLETSALAKLKAALTACPEDQMLFSA